MPDVIQNPSSGQEIPLRVDTPISGKICVVDAQDVPSQEEPTDALEWSGCRSAATTTQEFWSEHEIRAADSWSPNECNDDQTLPSQVVTSPWGVTRAQKSDAGQEIFVPHPTGKPSVGPCIDLHAMPFHSLTCESRPLESTLIHIA
jgi:hypothetical protein